MMSMRRFLASVLVLAMLVTALGSAGFAQANAKPSPSAPASAKGAEGKGNSLSSEAAGEIFARAAKAGPVTWARGAKLLCGMLGYLEEDAAGIDLTAYADRIPGLSADDDSLYLGILAANGCLDGDQPVNPGAKMSRKDFARLAAGAFGDAAASQEGADRLSAAEGVKNLIASGDGITLSALSADRVAAISGDLTLTGAKASALSILCAANASLSATELNRAVIQPAVAGDAGESVYLHLDADSRVPEIIVQDAGGVTIEGNGALGVVRVAGDVGSLTIRATCSVSNETDAEIKVTGPDGQAVSIPAGGRADLVLTRYVVSFVTDGTPVSSQLLSPGEAIDFGQVSTEKKGAHFTAWYEDAAFTKPYSTFGAVEGQLTLYARFLPAADAVTVSFETFGGAELAPLRFAKGEMLLCKPVSGLYASKEGYTFGGWCRDEACTVPFGYSDPIEGDMTLYALFTSNEPETSEEELTTAELKDFDWQGRIGLTVPEGMSLRSVKKNVAVEAGAGALAPKLSFEKTKGGISVYGAYYKADGAAGFEPGSTFTITASGGVGFQGYGAAVTKMVVTVYRAQVEVVEFAGGLNYVRWDRVTAYEPVVLQEGKDGEETQAQPGRITLDEALPFREGDIAVFYDGDVGRDERNITAWEKGAFDGYVLFAEVLGVAAEGGGEVVSFAYASPEKYLSNLDAHVTRDVDIDGVLDEEAIARIGRNIGAQVSANDELKAQMMVAVMSSPETQRRLDALYGAGVYQLAAITASFKPDKPSIDLSVSGHTATVTVSISATVTLKNGAATVLTVTPSLTFKQAVSLKTDISAGNVWVNVAATIQSKSTIRLEVNATSGGDSDMKILGEAKDTLERLVSPDGVDDSMDYTQSVNELMNTMQSLIQTSLPYNDLFATPLMNVSVSFYGIVTLGVQLDLVGQIGVLATFGIEIVVTTGERIGFNYNFLKLKGGSYTEKLPGDVTNRIYLIGKIGVRLGLRLTISLSLCGMARASITGELFAYAELTGMFFYVASLVTGGSTYLGALNFEVGLDASVKLSLKVNLLVTTVHKSWTVWKDRWPLYAKSASSKERGRVRPSNPRKEWLDRSGF